MCGEWTLEGTCRRGSRVAKGDTWRSSDSTAVLVVWILIKSWFLKLNVQSTEFADVLDTE